MTRTPAARHLAVLLVALHLLACGVTLKGLPLPERTLTPTPADFTVTDDQVALHYYGAGGWGIRWRGTYVLTAPYFTNHSMQWLAASQGYERTGLGPEIPVVPDVDRVRAGFAGTPVAETALVLLGHGHIDHAGDVPAYFEPGLIAGRPVLVADRSITNMLSPMLSRFSCVAPIDYGSSDDAAAVCPVPNVRVTAIHSAHAPHAKVAGLEVAAYGGTVAEPHATLPRSAGDYRLGNTWAFLIDLLAADGSVAFRIHYVDAATSPPHAIAPARLAAERDVDVHIACVPSFELADEYPEAVLRYHNVRYVLGGHWEDFFQPRTEPLRPLRFVLDGPLLEQFVNVVERTLGGPRGVAPLGPDAVACGDRRRCGPRSNNWALPTPGETFRFQTGPQPPAPALRAAGLRRTY